jgi:simple sugar transport system permease protein
MSRAPLRRALAQSAVIILSVALLFALLALALLLAGLDAGLALGAFWRGSLGTWDALTSATLVRATPLILAGLAVALAFRAGVWNIGAEGQLLAGAAAAAAVAGGTGSALGAFAIPLALAAGAMLGGTWAGIAAVLRRRWAVPEVIGTIMLNFIALYAVGYLVRGPLQEPTRVYPQSEMLPIAERLPRLVPDTRLHIGFLLAVAAAIVVWWTLRATWAGFRVRAAGENPDAARVVGRIDVERTTAAVFVASGMLAGLAGAVELTGVTYALYENLSPGYGYIAIAVALLAGLDPLAVVLTGVLFGALEAGALAMQREAGVPSTVVSVIEALLILALLAVERWRGGLALPAWMAGASRTGTPDSSGTP